LISLENLRYRYPGKGDFLLDAGRLRFEKGEFTALAGPNGAGKSTLMKVMAGLINGYEGAVKLEGKDIRRYKPAEFAAKVSYIPQAGDYMFDFTLAEIVAMGRRPYLGGAGVMKKRDHEIVNEALEGFGLSGKSDMPFAGLSGGEKRMALTARAVAQEAEILLMDEPTAYLDLHHASWLMEKLSALNAAGKTVVMILHDLNTAAEFMSRMIFISSGKVAFDGKPEKAMDWRILGDIYGKAGYFTASNPVTGKPNVFLKANK